MDATGLLAWLKVVTIMMIIVVMMMIMMIMMQRFVIVCTASILWMFLDYFLG